VNALRQPVNPALPNATGDYDRRAQDEYTRILRLYFNQLSNTFSGLLGTDGGKYLQFPCGSFSRATDFNFATANTATQIPVNTVDLAQGMVYVVGGGVQVLQAGVYNVQYSIQFVNTDSQIHAAWVWLDQNNTPLANTSSKFDVPAKHGASDGYLIAACNFYVAVEAGDTIQLYAAANQVENGVTDGVYLEAYVAQTTPFIMPAVPAAVLTVTFVSAPAT